MEFLLLFVNFLVYPGSGFFLLFAYYRLRQGIYAPYAWIMLFLLFVYSVVMAFFAFASRGYSDVISFYSPQMLMPVAIGIGILFYIFLKPKSRKGKTEHQTNKWRERGWRIFLIFIISVSPTLSAYATEAICFQANIAISQPLINALQAYQRENGQYPQEFWELVPDYLGMIPEPVCTGSYHALTLGGNCIEADASRETNHYLWIYLSYPPQQYDLSTGIWTWADFREWADC